MRVVLLVMVCRRLVSVSQWRPVGDVDPTEAESALGSLRHGLCGGFGLTAACWSWMERRAARVARYVRLR